MFQWPVLISIIFLFAFGVWASVQADVVKQTLETQWEDIRKFLPTTFEGRYDKVLFGEFLGKCEYMNNFLLLFVVFGLVNIDHSQILHIYYYTCSWYSFFFLLFFLLLFPFFEKKIIYK